MSNLFEKIEKTPFFFERNWPKKLLGEKISQQAIQLNGVPWITAKTLPFPSLLQKEDSNI